MNVEQSPASMLARFRSDRKRLPLHPLEKAVLAAVAVHLCFLPWALGTMHPWSQITSLVLSAVGLVIALIPRIYDGDLAPGIQIGGQRTENRGQIPMAFSPDAQRRDESRRSFSVGGQPSAMRLTAWPRLLRFPIFWIGLALLGYIVLQALNPSWVWERNATSWWLRRVNDIPWLPTSIDTPFERFNLWRQFIIYTSAWLTLCTVWIGFTRRRALQVLIIVLIINAALLAIVGFVQRVAGMSSATVLGNWDFPGASVFSTFIYKNHAGAYFALLASLAVAAAIWTRDNGERAFSKSTPASLLFFVSLLLGAGVLASASRGAVLTLVLFATVAALWYLIRRSRQPGRAGSNPAITVLIALFFVSISVATLRYSDFSAIQNRFADFSKNPAATMEGRLQAYDAGQDMLADHWQRGVGAGGFRHLYPEYVRKHPAIHEGGRLFWDQLHRDWVQIPIELGAMGSGLLVLGAGWWLLVFYRSRAIWHSLAVTLLLGCVQTLAHAWFDFPFQNPAILCTWLALIAISARWLELDAS